MQVVDAQVHADQFFRGGTDEPNDRVEVGDQFTIEQIAGEAVETFLARYGAETQG